MQKQAPLTKAPTIYDVAREAGVSPATVSRVMNHYSQVKRDTSERVIAAMKKLDFERNEAKSAPQLLGSSVNRALPSNQPRVFVLSVPHTASSPYAAFIEGAQTAAQKNGHHLLINSTPVDRYNFDFFIATMKSHNIAGILTTETIAAPDLSGINDHLPLVQCGEYNASVEQLSSISIDDTATARSAADILRARGARKLLYITAPLERQSLVRRSQGFQQSYAENEELFSPDFQYVLPSADPLYAAEKLTEPLKRVMPDAVLTSDARQAASVLRAADMLGIRVPDRLQILSLEDEPAAVQVFPAVSAMSGSYYEIGFRAFELLLSEFLDPYARKQHILLSSEYIRRETTLVP